MNNYELLDKDWGGNQLIKLTQSPYSGIIYSYGRVRLIEEDSLLRIQFEFNIHENPVGFTDRNKFRDYIGDILVELIDKNLISNSLVYTGGIDENRTEDSNQSDT